MRVGIKHLNARGMTAIIGTLILAGCGSQGVTSPAAAPPTTQAADENKATTANEAGLKGGLSTQWYKRSYHSRHHHSYYNPYNYNYYYGYKHYPSSYYYKPYYYDNPNYYYSSYNYGYPNYYYGGTNCRTYYSNGYRSTTCY